MPAVPLPTVTSPTAKPVTASLKNCPDAADTTSGVLAIRGADDLVVVLLRDEWLEQVHWAGEPVKHLVSTDDGVRMAPRRSFALWKETMRGRSQPWETQALADAEALQLLLSMRTR